MVNSKDFLGKKVMVKIDRPLGSKHPKYNYVYPVNYGYIENTISGDGEELDAYVLGVTKPLKSFTGMVVAIIHRLDENDDKLIVTNNKNLTNEQIILQTNFQEQYFKSEIIR